ncbi:MAG TPA: glycosyl hydrolase family 28-related protein, partial [Rhodanobacter sp.]|nr:glycosyl hydrolase family 28-related protein [Rhodanobacter sp.]
MERRQFLGSMPFAVGGALAMSSTASLAQTVQAPPMWTNVKAFGAIGDGIIDDTAAIKTAIGSLQQSNEYRGGVLYFPAGRYICSSTLTFSGYSPSPTSSPVHNIIVRGDGPQCTFIDFSGTTGGAAAFAFSAGAQFGIEDLLIHKASGHGVLIGSGNILGSTDYSNYFNIRNVRVQQCGGNGFMFLNAFMGTVSDCWSTTNGGAGFLFAGFHTSMHVSRCYASSNTGNGWSLNAMTYSSFTACGSDRNIWGYAMTNMIGVAFNACGTELNQREGWLLNTANSTVGGLPLNFCDIHGVTFTSCSSYDNSQAGLNAYGSHIAAIANDNRPIEFKISANTSFCRAGSTVSMVLNASNGPITVYDEISYFNNRSG